MSTLTRRATLAALLVITLLVLAGCSGQSGAAPEGLVGDGDSALRAPDSSDGGAGGVTDEDGGEEPAGEEPYAAPIEQRIVKTGEIGLTVGDVPVTLARVRAMALEVGGYVGGSQAGALDETASVTLRIPAARFDEVLTRLGELEDVEVVSMSTREEDVTNQVVDLRARIRNLEASEASYRVLFDRAQQIDDVLTVQARLDEVRGQIEQLEAQLEAVEAQAALSTLTVTIIPRDEPVAATQEGWDPGAAAATAVATLIGIGQAILVALLWFGIVVLPIGLAVAILAWLGLRLLPDFRRQLAPAEVPPREGGS